MLSDSSSQILIDFTKEQQQRWQVVNDGVMGGISQSTLLRFENYAEFRGTVSLENNGGFASVRTIQPANLSNFDGIRISTLGDDKVYSIRLKPIINNRLTAYSYEARFEASADGWQVYDIPFSAFEPVYRGSQLRNVPRLNTAAIGEIGIMIKDGQEGSFSLKIQKIEAYKSAVSKVSNTIE